MHHTQKPTLAKLAIQYCPVQKQLMVQAEQQHEMLGLILRRFLPLVQSNWQQLLQVLGRNLSQASEDYNLAFFFFKL